MSRHRKRREQRRSHHATATRQGRALAGAGLALGAAFAGGADAQAAVVTNNNDAGPNSLRQAVLDTNAGGDDSITFSAAVTGTITLTTGQLLVTDTVTITGPGANVLAISGNDASRVLSLDPVTPGESVYIYDLTIRNGFVAGDGGGIRNEDADLTLDEIALVNNQTTGGGGDGAGLYDQGAFNNGENTLVFDSTISGNTASDDGGGVYGRYSVGGIYGTTVSGNTALGDDGGGIYSYSNSYIGDSTIANNNALTGSGGGVADEGTGDITIDNTLIADNTALTAADAHGQVEAGFSLIENTNGATLTSVPAGSNITGQDPQLGPLQDNGGPTLTRRPGLASPALDRGLSATFADQRGQPRVFDIASLANAAGGNAADIGSVELNAAEAPPVPVVQTPVTPVVPQPSKKCKKKKKKGKKGSAAAKKCKKAKKKK